MHGDQGTPPGTGLYNPMVPIATIALDRWWHSTVTGGLAVHTSVPFEEDAVHFHKVHKEVKHDPSYYSRFKSGDEYFYVSHRGEAEVSVEFSSII